MHHTGTRPCRADGRVLPRGLRHGLLGRHGDFSAGLLGAREEAHSALTNRRQGATACISDLHGAACSSLWRSRQAWRTIATGILGLLRGAYGFYLYVSFLPFAQRVVPASSVNARRHQ